MNYLTIGILFSFLFANANTITQISTKAYLNSGDATGKPGPSAIFLTAPIGKSAVMNFRIKNTQVLFSLGLFNKEFLISSKDYKNICIKDDKYKSVEIKGNSILGNSLSVKGKVKFNETSQWRMVYYDSFNKNETSLGWNENKTTSCNFYQMIGGVCQTAEKEIFKEYTSLPAHTMLRIEALFHFLGTWDSHTGYLKVDFSTSQNRKDEKIVWSTRCKNHISPLMNIKLCPFETCKVADPINVTVNHSEKSLKIIFGSTLSGNPCERSYGVSDIRIYIR